MQFPVLPLWVSSSFLLLRIDNPKGLNQQSPGQATSAPISASRTPITPSPRDRETKRQKAHTPWSVSNLKWTMIQDGHIFSKLKIFYGIDFSNTGQCIHWSKHDS